MTEKPTYEQLERQLKLAELSNTALRFEVRKHKARSAQRLNRARVAEEKLQELRDLHNNV